MYALIDADNQFLCAHRELPEALPFRSIEVDEATAATLTNLHYYDQGEWKLTLLRTPVEELDYARQQAFSRINADRDQAEANGFAYLGKTFDSNPRAVQRISVAVQAAQAALAAGQSFNLTWTCADNSEIDLDASQILGLPVALALHANSQHQKAKALKRQVIAADSLEMIQAIQWGGL